MLSLVSKILFVKDGKDCKMKQLFKKLIFIIIRLLSNIYTYGINQLLSRAIGMLYSIWIRQFIGEVGENSGFSKPLLLQGGGQHLIKIGSHTHFGHHCVLGCWERNESSEGVEHYEPEIVIGNYCSIGEYCHITALHKITIGDGLLTGRFVYIGDNAHGGLSWEEAAIPPSKRKLISKGEIIIGRNVWIGDKVTILGGVTIGDNVIIGANTVVTHDIPSNTVFAGNKIIKSLTATSN